MKDLDPSKKGRIMKTIEPYLWLLPCLLLMCIFILYPVGNVIYMAFSKISKSGIVKEFGTLRNFEALYRHKPFGRVLLNTFVWTVAIVSISTVLGMIMALVLNIKFRGVKIARAVLIIPWATSGMIFACTWKYILDYNYGSLNALLMKIGLVKEPINWLGTSSWGAFACMIFVGILVTVPFITFTLLSGLQSISMDYYEAATVDGANAWQRFANITLPLLRPALNVSTVLNIIYVFNSFAIVHNITGGAPSHQTDTIMTYMYSAAFKGSDYGKAAAASVIAFVILMIISWIYMRLMMKEDE